MVLGGVVLKIWPHTSGLLFRDTLFTRDPLIALLQKPKGCNLKFSDFSSLISTYLPTRNKENPRCWVDSCGELAWNDPLTVLLFGNVWASSFMAKPAQPGNQEKRKLSQPGSSMV